MFDEMNRWVYAFLQGDSRLSAEDRFGLLTRASVMYFRNETELKVETDTFSGVISTKGDYGLIGSFGGQRFDAELETNDGKVNLKFLISEQTGAGSFQGASRDAN